MPNVNQLKQSVYVYFVRVDLWFHDMVEAVCPPGLLSTVLVSNYAIPLYFFDK